MSRICRIMGNSWKSQFHKLEHESKIGGSSKPTPTPLDGKVTKPARYVKKEKKGEKE